jgi:multicomponent Na+:H+ antiporter subunit C
VTLVEAALVAVLVAVGTYLVLNRTLTRIILGLAVLANAVNLLVLTSGSSDGDAPIVGTAEHPTDPVPQALVLTAIVIGLAMIAFLLAVAYRSWTIDGNDEVEDDIEDRRLALAGDTTEGDAADGDTADGDTAAAGDVVEGTAAEERTAPPADARTAGEEGVDPR